MSKGIDALNNLLLEISEVVIDEKTMLPGFKLPKHQCERIEIVKKELRALEIIVTKKVNLYGDDLYANGVYGLNYYSTYQHYKASCEKLRYKKKSILTEEEFNLLKEVLK
jgi:hypothetical protein